MHRLGAQLHALCKLGQFVTGSHTDKNLPHAEVHLQGIQHYVMSSCYILSQ